MREIKERLKGVLDFRGYKMFITINGNSSARIGSASLWWIVINEVEKQIKTYE